MKTKKCTGCLLFLPLDNFSIKQRKPTILYYSMCKKCRYTKYSNPERQKEYAIAYYTTNKEKILQQSRDKYHKDIEKSREYKRDSAKRLRPITNERKRIQNKELRNAFLSMYGNKCTCCGETHKEFLTLEHKLGQVGIKRSKKANGKWSYFRAIKEYRPDLYEILCYNCNCSKGRYGYCPHTKS